ncbi:MAG TPA: decarboxylating 6-phosphogluconate dehydrogenase [Verrucomicrobiae bacterium]|nr:decarboxylating 6-phosphogluconate dehydrogenase [Verrucomicrobiae bacterium]
MKIGFIGLGRMGGNMVARLLRAGHEVVAFDRAPEAMRAPASLGAQTATSPDSLVAELTPPRIVWVMLPAGAPTFETIRRLAEKVSPGDVIVDGGNCNYKDALHHAAMLKKLGIRFLDVGTSNGIWGNKEGYGMMVGGEPETIELLRPVFEALAPAPDRGWGRVGPNGAGHYIKTVHNGIEYGVLQALAEGFELMQHKPEFELDVARVATIWQQGSVIRSWLLELIGQVLAENPRLEGVTAYVEDNGTGRWAMEEALETGSPAPVISLALQWRYRSRMQEPFGDKLLAVLRNRFGGHAIKAERSERDALTESNGPAANRGEISTRGAEPSR